MSAETFFRWQIVACNVVNSALYLRHSLRGSARIDQTINQLASPKITWSLSTNQVLVYKFC